METNKLNKLLETDTKWFVCKSMNFGFITTFFYNDDSIRAVFHLETSMN